MICHDPMEVERRPDAQPLWHVGATARAEPAALSRESDESIEPGGGAPNASEACGQAAAPQEVTDNGYQTRSKIAWRSTVDASPGQGAVLPYLRFALDLRDALECGRHG